MKEKLFDPEHIRAFVAALPFFLMSGDTIKLNWSRIIEAMLIAVLTAGFSGYMLISKLDTKLTYIEGGIMKLENRVERIEQTFINER